MKAISVKQPWAELIVRGIKKIEIRKWYTGYRGEILIHSSTKVDKEALEYFPYEEDELIKGYIIGVVRLVGIKEYKSKDEFKKDFNKHLSFKFPRGKVYGWILENPRKLKRPIPIKGKLGIFDVFLDIDLERDVEKNRKITDYFRKNNFRK